MNLDRQWSSSRDTLSIFEVKGVLRVEEAEFPFARPKKVSHFVLNCHFQIYLLSPTPVIGQFLSLLFINADRRSTFTTAAGSVLTFFVVGASPFQDPNRCAAAYIVNHAIKSVRRLKQTGESVEVDCSRLYSKPSKGKPSSPRSHLPKCFPHPSSPSSSPGTIS